MLGHDWGVDLRAVRCRTALWHGAADKARAGAGLKTAALGGRRCSCNSLLCAACHPHTAHVVGLPHRTLLSWLPCLTPRLQIVPPSHSAWYHATIPGASQTVVEGEGHISLAGRHAAAILQDLLAAAGLGGATPAAAAAAVGAAGLGSGDSSSMLSKDSGLSGKEASELEAVGEAAVGPG